MVAALSMPRPSVAILAKIVIRHEEKAEPEGEKQAASPRKKDAQENPVGHAQNQTNGTLVVVAEDIADTDGPRKNDSPGAHDERPFPPGVAEKLLFLATRFG
jgi:hypothetical protein